MYWWFIEEMGLAYVQSDNFWDRKTIAFIEFWMPLEEDDECNNYNSIDMNDEW